jgi:hypothetical protein
VPIAGGPNSPRAEGRMKASTPARRSDVGHGNCFSGKNLATNGWRTHVCSSARFGCGRRLLCAAPYRNHVETNGVISMRTSATTICALATLVFPIGGCRQASAPEPRQQLDSHVQEDSKDTTTPAALKLWRKRTWENRMARPSQTSINHLPYSPTPVGLHRFSPTACCMCEVRIDWSAWRLSPSSADSSPTHRRSTAMVNATAAPA